MEITIGFVRKCTDAWCFALESLLDNNKRKNEGLMAIPLILHLRFYHLLRIWGGLTWSTCGKCFLFYDFRGFTFYKMSNLDNRISNPDQLLTQDVDKFCDCVAELYSNLSKVSLCLSLSLSLSPSLSELRLQNLQSWSCWLKMLISSVIMWQSFTLILARWVSLSLPVSLSSCLSLSLKQSSFLPHCP